MAKNCIVGTVAVAVIAATATGIAYSVGAGLIHVGAVQDCSSRWNVTFCPPLRREDVSWDFVLGVGLVGTIGLAAFAALVYVMTLAVRVLFVEWAKPALCRLG